MHIRGQKQREREPPPQWTFAWICAIGTAFVFRIGLLLLSHCPSRTSSLSSLIRHWLSSPSSPLRAALTDGVLTLNRAKEANALLNLMDASTLYKNFTVNNIVAGDGGASLYEYYTRQSLPPPLLTRLASSLYSTKTITTETAWSEKCQADDLMVGMLLSLLFDALVAWSLYQLACNCCRDVDQEEEQMEALMDPVLLPRYGWIFDFPSLETTKKNEDTLETDEKDDIPEATKPQDSRTVSHLTILDKNQPPSATTTTFPPPIISLRNLPVLISTLYYCHPTIILASSTLLSFGNILHGLYVQALVQGVRGQGPMAALSVGLIWYLEGGKITLGLVGLSLVCVLLLLERRRRERLEKGSTGPSDGGAALCVGVAFGLCLIMWCYLIQTLSNQLLPSHLQHQQYRQLNTMQEELSYILYPFPRDLSPNMGMSWYLFTQMFHEHEFYFVVMMSGLPFVYLAPLAIRFHKYPIALATMYYQVNLLHSPKPTLHDATFALLLLLLSPRTLVRVTPFSLLSLLALPIPCILFCLDYAMWTQGMRNVNGVNYMYFQCLAWFVLHAVILLEFVVAGMRRDKVWKYRVKTGGVWVGSWREGMYYEVGCWLGRWYGRQ